MKNRASKVHAKKSKEEQGPVQRHEETHEGPIKAPPPFDLRTSTAEPGQLGDMESEMSDENAIQRAVEGGGFASAPPPPNNNGNDKNTGLPSQLKSGMENLTGHSMDDVKVHYNSEKPAQMKAHAFAQGSEIHVAPGQEKHVPHELGHVVQQKENRVQANTQVNGKGVNDDPGLEKEATTLGDKAMQLKSKGGSLTKTSAKGGSMQLMAQDAPMQFTIGDGHDLASPRFEKIEDLEAAYDDEQYVRKGSTGRGVQAIQQSLYDLGFDLGEFGANGEFNDETDAAVKAYQRANPPLEVDGIVGPKTMESLDQRFAAFAMPGPAELSAQWTPAVVKRILEPWSPHTVEVLRTRITLKSFDRIYWADEEWDGSAWVPSHFEGGGYQDHANDEIGIINASNESVSQTLYHEILHAEQPTSQTTTLEKESYAYRIGEEMAISWGFSGRPDLRETDAQGREYADDTKTNDFVSDAYPSVGGGAPGEEIVRKGPNLGEVIVRRPDNSTYTRQANAGEKVPGPIHLVGEQSHPRSVWN